MGMLTIFLGNKNTGEFSIKKTNLTFIVYVFLSVRLLGPYFPDSGDFIARYHFLGLVWKSRKRQLTLRRGFT